MKLPRAWGLVVGDEPLPATLRRACHEARLVGGLSLSLRATPDEVVGPLTYAMGGAARRLRVLDVREGPPLMMEIGWNDVVEKWDVEDLPALINNLDSLFADQPDVKALIILGEWEDMLQVWGRAEGARRGGARAVTPRVSRGAPASRWRCLRARRRTACA